MREYFNCVSRDDDPTAVVTFNSPNNAVRWAMSNKCVTRIEHFVVDDNGFRFEDVVWRKVKN